MKNLLYKNAPVSEVIFGITYNQPVISLEILFSIYSDLKEKYPIIEILPPIADTNLEEFKLTEIINPKTSGHFLLRLKSQDYHWLFQLQRNKVYFNWIRPDTKKPGGYPGYALIENEFIDIIKILDENYRVDTLNNVKYFDLTYHDRVEWQEYINSINDINEILNFNLPKISNKNGLNNIFSKYTYPEEMLGGHGVLNINTGTSISDKQLMNFENVLRGYKANLDQRSWFELAHKKQVEQFQYIFNKNILNKWK